MSALIEAMYDIKYNPFVFADYLISFYSTLDNVDNNMILAPLVIPICTHPEFSKKLERATTKSSLLTQFNDKKRLYDLQERFDFFKDLTTDTINYCLVNEWLSIDTESLCFSVSVKNQSKLKQVKSAVNLGKVSNGYAISEVYGFLGVKP